MCLQRILWGNSLTALLFLAFSAVAEASPPLSSSAASSAASSAELNAELPDIAERLYSGDVTAEDFADISKRLITEDPLRRKALSDILLRKAEAILVSQPSADAANLRKASREIFGENSSEYVEMIRLFNVVDQTEHFAGTGNLTGFVNLRREMRSPSEKRLLEVKLARFMISSAEENIRNNRPVLALRQIAEIKPEWRTKNSNELAARAIAAINTNAALTIREAKFAELFDAQVVQGLIASIETFDPGVSSALAVIYAERTLDAAKSGSAGNADAFFSRVIKHRPDPNPDNDKLRLQLALIAGNSETREFASKRIYELKKSGKLSIVDKIKLLTSGYASVGVKVLVGLLLAILGFLLIFWVTAKYAPAIAKGLRRGKASSGYQREIQDAPTDEYSRLLEMFGLDDTASEEKIKKTYRQIVKDYHPDSAEKQDEETVKRFIELREAYQRILQIRSSWFG